ncbi:carbamoyl phosphate synthase small subunit [Methylophilales bacterium MBRSG12]|uniref:Carbamoyl phosphate synthase small chain n=1 Tax=Methylophilales bacterium MBRS-H7 TaxID=1623450 RepID=A0A0H4IYT1_9PROT|nr:carbamoyl phosphate synthase small subunit [Methylophilales bacterium MBRSF5]AKO66151.1 carbamoyl phosphate synthase small subunit [Methylophilales bacterium MBRS-H7]AKO67470.1 carbamoyl phosphate synthase small subunit [Methylophilales bacterium MBRSG12]
MSEKIPALLILKDGTRFHGTSIGANTSSVGEVVFNTSITGYQEILTDPSYAEQIVTLTYPHIGNTGTNNEDYESNLPYCKGLIIHSVSPLSSNFRNQKDLVVFLKEHNIPAITDLDTRKLTRHIRNNGAQPGLILIGKDQDNTSMLDAFPGLSGMDLAKVVSTKKQYAFDEGEWSLGEGHKHISKTQFKVVAYDFGIKKNILRMLASRGADLIVVPAEMDFQEVLKLNPDGIFLSNGPGDPEPCKYAIKNIKEFLKQSIPIFGICLGHQLLSLALGAQTKKMKFGHHGANHPVQDLNSKKVFITSQNHGFTVDESSLNDNIVVTHKSLFDQTIQGIESKNKLAFSFQGHPEASPGPTEMAYLFDQFFSNMQVHKGELIG